MSLTEAITNEEVTIESIIQYGYPGAVKSHEKFLSWLKELKQYRDGRKYIIEEIDRMYNDPRHHDNLRSGLNLAKKIIIENLPESIEARDGT